MISARLVELRKKRRLSQQRLADLAGLSRATIAAIEGGRYRSVDSATVQKLARALRARPSALIDERTVPHLATRADVIEDFLGSPWPKAVRLTTDEVAWLDAIPLVMWRDVAETPQAVAELLAWHRRHKR